MKDYHSSIYNKQTLRLISKDINILEIPDTIY